MLLACSLCWPLNGQALSACQTRNLTIELKRQGVGMERLAYFYVLTNRGNLVCTLSGYPSAAALNSEKKAVDQIRFEQVQPNDGDPDDWKVRTIRLKPGEHAWFRIQTQDGTGLEDTSFCRTAAWVRITPPQNHVPFQQLFPFVDCISKAYIYFLEAGTE
jgi:hypothetical protein